MPQTSIALDEGFDPAVDYAAFMPDPPYFDETAIERSGAKLPATLEQLEALIFRDLNMTRYSSKRWAVPRVGPDGREALNVLIVGAGQAGLAAGFGLMQHRIDKVLIVDESPEGLEGPWSTHARMPTLRTHKDNGGIELGIPNLSMRAWYEVQHGHGSWEALYKVDIRDWHAYLNWYRKVLGLHVRNSTRLSDFGPGPDGLVRVELTTDHGTETLFTRTLVFATGMEGNGARYIPSYIAEALEPQLRSHTNDAIDFAAFAGQRVAVLGGGASAYDNAIKAAEAGASVDIHHRMNPVITLNTVTWAEFNGFLAHYPDLSPLEKWEYCLAIMRLKGGPPIATIARAGQLPNLRVHAGQNWMGVRQDGDAVAIEATDGPLVADHVILGTGYSVDLAACDELVPHLSSIALWRDAFTPPPASANPGLAGSPWLGSHFEFQQKTPGCAPWFERVFNFSRGALLSMGVGPVGLSGIKFGVPRLVEGVGKRLFLDDTDVFMQGMQRWYRSDLTHLDT